MITKKENKPLTRNETESCEKENTSAGVANFHDDGRIEIKRPMEARNMEEKKEEDGNWSEERMKKIKEWVVIGFMMIQSLVLIVTLLVSIRTPIPTVLEQPIGIKGAIEILPTLPIPTQSGNEKSDTSKSDLDTNNE